MKGVYQKTNVNWEGLAELWPHPKDVKLKFVPKTKGGDHGGIHITVKGIDLLYVIGTRRDYNSFTAKFRRS